MTQPNTAVSSTERNGIPPACTLEHVNPSLLLPPKQDIRDRTGSEYRDWFDRLVADVMERNVQQPIIGYRDGDLARAKIRVLDGETRRLAALVAGLETVPVLVYPQEPDADGKEVGQLQANAMRQDMTDVEYARVYLRIMERTGWIAAEVARHLHHEAGTVSKRLSVLKKLPEDLLALIGDGEGKIPFSAAYPLSRLSDVPTIRDLAEKIRQGLLKRDAVERHVSALLGGKKPKKEKPRKITVGNIVMLIKGKLTDELEALATRIQDLVKKVRKEGLPDEVMAVLLKP